MINVEKLKAMKEETHRELENLREKATKVSLLLKPDELIAVLEMIYCLGNFEATINLLLDQIEKVGGQIVFVGEENSHV